MKKATLFFVLVALIAPLHAQEAWEGLWRANRYFNGRLEAVHHIHISFTGAGPQVRIYADDARPMTINQVSFLAEENRLTVGGTTSETQPLNMEFNLSLTETGMQGDWSAVHMQLMAPLAGELSAFRALDTVEWDPWQAVEERRETRSLDITGMLVSQAPYEGFEAFRSYWDSKIEPKFYFILDGWLYGRNLEPAEHKDRVLRDLYNRLSDESFRSQLLDLSPIFKRTVETSKLVWGTDDIRVFLISLPAQVPDPKERIWSRVPTPQDEADCACALDLREQFTFMNPARFSDVREGAVLAEKLALSSALWQDLRLPPLAIQVFRKSLALAYAMEVNQADWPIPEESVVAARIEFADLLMTAEDMTDNLGEALAGSLSYGLGLAYVRKMREQHSLTDLFRLSTQEIMTGWRSFLEKN